MRLTALAFVLIIGKADRFRCGKQIASYLGLVPLEDSSGNRRRLGHITKQGSSMMRFLLVEAAQVTVRSVPEWRSKYLHLMMRRGTENRQGRDGPQAGGSSVLDVAQGMGLSAVGTSSVRRVENPALMLEYPLLPPDSRGCEVPESSD